MVDIILEGRRGVIEAKRYYKGLEEAKPCDKGCLLLIAFYNLEFVKYGDDI